MKFKQRLISFISIIIALICVLNFNNLYIVKADEKVYLGGFTAGFSVQTLGAKVVGICDVVTLDGVKSPSKEANIKVDDIILYIDSVRVDNASDIAKEIKGKSVVDLTILRQNEQFNTKIIVAKDVSGVEKLGLFIKDDINGIGTITFIKGDRFASLGHPIVSEDGNNLKITSGNLYNCSISGCIKGEKGKAGELRGVFIKNNPIGNIDKNLNTGVYGTINENFNKTSLKEVDIGDAKIGEAKIYSTIDNNKPKYYSISIVKIDIDNDSKNFVIKINDEELLSKTNGIVQGMSGSPIIQNNKLVGAVTHVFINDPTRGFGLSIEKMINN